MAKKFKQHYFPHDAFAREDPKIVRLRIAHGSAGYGVYFMLLEYLCSQPGFVSETTYNELGYNLHESASMVKSVVEDFGLFTLSDDGKWFHSESFSRRMASIDSTAKSRSSAASKAAKARWAKAPTSSIPKSDAEVMRDASEKDADAMRDASVLDAYNKIRKEYPPPPACAREELDFREELLGEQKFWEDTARLFKTDRESTIGMMDEFLMECSCKGKTHESFTDFRKHLFDWLRIHTEILKRKKKNGNNETTLRRGRAESTATCPDDFEGGF